MKEMPHCQPVSLDLERWLHFHTCCLAPLPTGARAGGCHVAARAEDVHMCNLYMIVLADRRYSGASPRSPQASLEL